MVKVLDTVRLSVLFYLLGGDLEASCGVGPAPAVLYVVDGSKHAVPLAEIV